MTRPSEAVVDRKRQIEELGPWFHNLHLPDGLQTAPDHFLGDFPSYKWAHVAQQLPEDLSGWSALDVGCNAGFYSFELAKRGARVTGIDSERLYLEQARWAARELGVEGRVEFREMSVYDIGRSETRYDLVLFMGVFYHLRHPLLALDILATKVKRRMIFQTLTMPGMEELEPPPDMPIMEREAMLEPGWPKMAFIERKLAGDMTNWWAPNHAAVLAMLRSTGLDVVSQPGHEIYVCEPKRADSDDERQLLVRRELAAITGQR
jgi:tRNA (mo5U34)-methyltransferase